MGLLPAWYFIVLIFQSLPKKQEYKVISGFLTLLTRVNLEN